VDTESAGPAEDPFKAHVVREGTDATVVVYGPLVPVALAAANAAAEDGRSIEVIDLRSISPIDFDAIEASVRKRAGSSWRMRLPPSAASAAKSLPESANGPSSRWRRRSSG
jgi:hypothetical protein